MYISHQFPCFVKRYKIVRTDACRVMEGKRVNEEREREEGGKGKGGREREREGERGRERKRGGDSLALFCDSILKRLSADSASVAMAFSLTILRNSLIPENRQRTHTFTTCIQLAYTPHSKQT